MPGAADGARRRLVGARVRHVEDARLVRGQARYTDDVRLSGALHAAFVRSTEAHALVRGIDVERARRAPGVVAVLTAGDIAGACAPIVARSSLPAHRRTEQPLLAGEKVRMVGEPLAVVVAEDRYAAEDGADLVDVVYDRLPAVTGIEEALAAGAPPVHASAPDNVHVFFERVTGDIDSAFADADLIVELETRTRRCAAVCLEPRACAARHDDALGELTVWMSTQTPHLFRTGLAEILHMPEHRIRVIAPAVGGGFGQKAVLHPDEALVPVLARMLGRPVRWTSDRREDLAASAHGRDQLHRVRAAVRDDGRVLAIRADLHADNGAYSNWPSTAVLDVAQAAESLPGPYDLRAYERRCWAVVTNKAPLGPYRGVGRPSACLTIERLMDEVARRLDLDPAEVRRRNLIRELPAVTVSDLHLDSGDYLATLELGLERIGYQALREQHRRLAGQGTLRGVGLALNVQQTGNGRIELDVKGARFAAGYDTAQLRVEPDGSVRIAVGLHSHGQGHETTIAQIAADELGVDMEDVSVVYGDTAQVPFGFGTYASRSTVYCGGATILAARDVVAKATAIAAHALEADPGDVELRNGRFAVRGDARRGLGWREVAELAHHRPARLPPGLDPGLDVIRRYAAADWGSFAHALHVAEVEVDPETGEVEILRYVVVEDCGTAVNPAGVEAQIHGGVAQGLGGTLLEEMSFDEEGRMLADSLRDYLLPTFVDVPEIEVHRLESPSPVNVGGFKGVGEGGCINVAPAVANAIIDALRPIADVSLNATPITPERILEQLGRARAGAAA